MQWQHGQQCQPTTRNQNGGRQTGNKVYVEKVSRHIALGEQLFTDIDLIGLQSTIGRINTNQINLTNIPLASCNSKCIAGKRHFNLFCSKIDTNYVIKLTLHHRVLVHTK